MPQQVLSVEQDQIWYLDALVSQTDAPWGLGSISHQNEPSTTYIYDDSAGADTYGYVIDTGINIDHVEFGGRASLGHTCCLPHYDDAGHGTHVAGTIGGSTYGVAKAANLISVKVFQSGRTSTTIIMNGLQWSVDEIINNNRIDRSVINISIGRFEPFL